MAEILCADCSHTKDDARFHLDAPGTNWGAALHWFRALKATSANAHQVGGEHYRALNAELQHWDLVAATGMGYFEGQVSRYIARWRRKNGAEDVVKALHYTDKLLELVHGGQYVYRVSCTNAGWTAFKRFALEQRLTRTEELAFELCINWTTTRDLERLRRLIAKLSEDAESCTTRRRGQTRIPPGSVRA